MSTSNCLVLLFYLIFVLKLAIFPSLIQLVSQRFIQDQRELIFVSKNQDQRELILVREKNVVNVEVLVEYIE